SASSDLSPRTQPPLCTSTTAGRFVVLAAGTYASSFRSVPSTERYTTSRSTCATVGVPPPHADTPTASDVATTTPTASSRAASDFTYLLCPIAAGLIRMTDSQA